MDPSKKEEISERIVLNSIQETVDTILENFELGKREKIIDAIRSLDHVAEELGKEDLWKAMRALCKLAENTLIEEDVRIEALEVVGFLHNLVVPSVAPAPASGGHAALDSMLPEPSAEALENAGAEAARNLPKPGEPEAELAKAFLHLSKSREAGVADAAKRIMQYINPLLRKKVQHAESVGTEARIIAGGLRVVREEAAFTSWAERLEKITPELGLDALWEMMDVLGERAEEEGAPLEVRRCAFEAMPSLYRKIAVRTAQERVQELCFSEIQMAKVLVNASLGQFGDELVEAATQAMDNIPSREVEEMLSCGFLGKTSDREGIANQVREERPVGARSTIRNQLARFLYDIEN